MKYNAPKYEIRTEETMRYCSHEMRYKNSDSKAEGERLSISNKNLDFRNLVVQLNNFLKAINRDRLVKPTDKHVY